MDLPIVGLLSTLVGAAIGLFGSLISNIFSVRKDRAQQLHEQTMERERWLRDQLQQIYSNCIYYLSMIASSPTEDIEAENVDTKSQHVNAFHESQKWLGLLLVYHPEYEKKNYDSLQKQILDFCRRHPLDNELARSLRDYIIWLASEDPRLPIRDNPQMPSKRNGKPS